MDEPIARYYVAENNPDGVYLPGVPLDDIPESRWAALPAWIQASADAWSAYRKTAPAARKTSAKEER